MQTYTSKMTSVNSTKLPAIYKKINWEQVRLHFGLYPPTILDYGCGRYTNHIKDFMKNDFIWYGYDPYWNPITIHEKYFDIVVCTNVLNVINDTKEVERIHEWIKTHSAMYFISVYEGDRSYISRETKKDCFQANLSTSEYVHHDEVIRKKIITNWNFKQFIL